MRNVEKKKSSKYWKNLELEFPRRSLNFRYFFLLLRTVATKIPALPRTNFVKMQVLIELRLSRKLTFFAAIVDEEKKLM
jgi:hypothetical protein